MSEVAVMRPAPPRRAISLMPALAVTTSAMALVGVVAGAFDGFFWGALLAAALVLGLRMAGERPTSLDGLAIGSTLAIAGWLTNRFLLDAVELLTPWVAVEVAAVWMVAGGLVAWVVRRHRPSSNPAALMAMWGLSGLAVVAMPGVLERLTVEDGKLGAATFVIAGIAIALVAGSATLAAVTGVRGIGIGGAVFILTWFAGARVGFTLTGLVDNFANIANIPNFWPPDFSWAIGEGVWWNPVSWDFGSPTLANPLIETFQIGIIASVLGCLVALPVAFMASRITTPNTPTYVANKGFMNVIRTIPDLFWAILFRTGVGVGPLAGVLALFFFSLAIMSKLFSETVDSVDTGPLEAAKATGSTHFPAVRSSVLPEVLPNYVAYALYIFELTIRASVVIGLVGAGGIGRVIEAQRGFFQFDRVFAIVIVMLVIVFVIEQVSVYFRRRLV